METRIRMNEAEPEGFKVMLSFEKFLNGSKLTAIHKDLLKIRASQINGCRYCIDLHTKRGAQAGENEQRIYALNAWRETLFFTEEEKAVLALTEEVTLIQNRVSDHTYATR